MARTKQTARRSAGGLAPRPRHVVEEEVEEVDEGEEPSPPVFQRFIIAPAPPPLPIPDFSNDDMRELLARLVESSDHPMSAPILEEGEIAEPIVKNVPIVTPLLPKVKSVIGKIGRHQCGDPSARHHPLCIRCVWKKDVYTAITPRKRNTFGHSIINKARTTRLVKRYVTSDKGREDEF